MFSPSLPCQIQILAHLRTSLPMLLGNANQRVDVVIKAAKQGETFWPQSRPSQRNHSNKLEAYQPPSRIPQNSTEFAGHGAKYFECTEYPQRTVRERSDTFYHLTHWQT